MALSAIGTSVLEVAGRGDALRSFKNAASPPFVSKMTSVDMCLAGIPRLQAQRNRIFISEEVRILLHFWRSSLKRLCWPLVLGPWFFLTQL